MEWCPDYKGCIIVFYKNTDGEIYDSKKTGWLPKVDDIVVGHRFVNSQWINILDRGGQQPYYISYCEIKSYQNELAQTRYY